MNIKPGYFQWYDVNFQTALHYAAENNSKEIGEILISKGAKINAIDTDYQNIKTNFKLRLK